MLEKMKKYYSVCLHRCKAIWDRLIENGDVKDE